MAEVTAEVKVKGETGTVTITVQGEIKDVGGILYDANKLAEAIANEQEKK